MPESHIAIVDPAAKTAELDTFNRMSRTAPVPLTYHLPGMFGVDSLKRSDDGLRGIVVLGSATSVYDGLPWQKELSDWLVPKMRRGIPTLGLCFGHQLIAHLFGAKVGFVRPDKGKLQGFRATEIEAGGPWKKAKGPLFVSHRERVETCPASFRIIAKSPEVPVDGIAHESLPIFGLQAHAEATPGLLHNLKYDGPRADFGFGQGLVDAFFHFALTQK